MDKTEFEQRMKENEDSFGFLWQKIVSDTNEFISDNTDITMRSLSKTKNFCYSLCLSGAWIQDRINGKSGVYSSPKYCGSLTKKIRKALGYTY